MARRKTEWLPGGPLGEALERMVCEALRKEELARKLGTTSKTINAWRAGRGVEPELADKVLLRTHLHWWDVWTEENTEPDALARVRRAFEGGGSLGVAA
jgi:DNA-binding XRE family transcriptional regulator